MSDTESSGPAGGESLKHRLREELRKYLIVSAYLYICFGALQFYKAALLQDAGVHYLPLGVAVVKALIIPNKAFMTERLVNWTLSDPAARLLLKVGVAYSTDIARVQQLMHARRGALELRRPALTPRVVVLGGSWKEFARL
jgi:hypothetical protein